MGTQGNNDLPDSDAAKPPSRMAPRAGWPAELGHSVLPALTRS